MLDLGCGNGVPVARSLAAAGYQVTGVDISDVQVERARRLVPAGTFIRADATVIEFPPRSFDAIVCLYSLIHMPLADQPGLLPRAAGWLRPAGWLLAVTGHSAWTGTEDNWLGGPASMSWSQADAGTSAHGLSRRAFKSPPRSSSPRGLAAMSSSGPVGRQADLSGPSSCRKLPSHLGRQLRLGRGPEVAQTG